MDCIILAGGFGTRLGNLTKNTPKPMLKINKLPFLELLVKRIIHTKLIKNIFISTFYKSNVIYNYFKLKDYPIQIIKDKKPLGTGGAIKNSLKRCSSRKVLVLNGDTFVNVNLRNFIQNSFKIKKNTMLLVKKKNNGRFSSIKINNKKINFIKNYSDKKKTNINAGIYILKKNIFNNFEKEIFSFEDFLVSKVDFKNWNFITSNSFFLDIGINKDYLFSKKKLKKYE